MPSRRTVLATIAGVGPVGIAGCGGGDASTPPLYDQVADADAAWTTAARDPANTRHAPRESVASPSPVWRVSLPGNAAEFPPLLTEQGWIVVCSDRALRVLNPDGSERWRFAVGEDEHLDGPPVVGRGNLAVVVDGTLRVFTLDGDERWRRPVGWTHAAPVLTRRYSSPAVVHATARGVVRSFHRRRGDLLWEHEAFGGVDHAPAFGFPTSGREPLLAVATTAGVELLDAAGVGYWRRSLPRPAAARPVLNRGRVLVSDVGGVVHAFDVDTGDHRWQTRVVDPVPGQSRFPLAATAERVFVADGRRLHALGHGGRKRWAWGSTETDARAPVVVGGGAGRTSDADLRRPGTVVVAADDRLVGLAADGGTTLGPLQWNEVAWETSAAGRPGPFAVADDRLYATVSQGDEPDELVAFE